MLFEFKFSSSFLIIIVINYSINENYLKSAYSPKFYNRNIQNT